MIEELLHFRRTHLHGVAFVMEEDVLPCPVTVCFCSTWAEVLASADGVELVE